MIRCPSCTKREATKDPVFGVLPCHVCQKRQAKLSPKKQVEFTSESIKEQRAQFRDDIEQPHRKGELNKRWLELYGEQAALNRGFSKAEIKRARYVYSGDDSYYNKNNHEL